MTIETKHNMFKILKENSYLIPHEYIYSSLRHTDILFIYLFISFITFYKWRPES